MSTLQGEPTFVAEFVECLRSRENVATVVLRRPKANALSLQLVQEIELVAGYLSADPPAAVVIWGGRKIFSAGADIAEMGGSKEARVATQAFRRAFDRVAAIPRVVIAAINGYALGGGLELALACDFRVIGRGARAGLPEVQLGLLPGAGGTQRLPRLIGTSRAKELILSGRHVSGTEAVEIGLADRVVEDDEVWDAAQSWAAEFAAGPHEAQGLAKTLIATADATDLRTGLDVEGVAVAGLFDTPDAQSGIRSFLERGPGQAVFTGS